MSKTKMISLNANGLKSAYELACKKRENGGFFFTRETLKFFGDTMSNYGVTKDVKNNVYILNRKKPVKEGVISDHFFCGETFKEANNLESLLNTRQLDEANTLESLLNITTIKKEA